MARYDFSFFDSGVRFDSPDAHPTNMRDLHRFLENPFDDPGISLAELLSFSSDHRQRMIANNPGGELTARIAATTSALDLVAGSATDDETKLALRKARIVAKNAFRDALPGQLAKISGAVVAQYGEEAPEVVECFPLGRTIFSQCTDDRLAQHLEVLLAGVTAHVADLGAPLVAKVQALVDEWESVFGASETAGGAKTTTQEAKRLARENLQLMLFLNLVKLMEMFPRQSAQLDLYMQQSLLEDHPSAPPEEPPAPTPPAP